MTLFAIIIVGVLWCVYSEGKEDAIKEAKGKAKQDYLLLGYLLGSHEKD